MRVLIVDDEAPARARLRRLLEQERIDAIAEAADAGAALDQIAQARPDVLFLDIQMPGTSGIALAAALPDPAPLLVFTTAHEAYAVEAFDTDAADYLLKPFDAGRLARALARVRKRLADLPAPAPVRARLLVPERGATRVVAVRDIGWIETADNYVILHTAGAQPLLRQTMASLLAELGPGFVRCHRRAAVQAAWVERVLARPRGDCQLQLRDGALVPCSRQYRAAVLAALRPVAAAAAGGPGRTTAGYAPGPPRA
jgi:two-component system LytT family response regulator